MKQVIQNFKTGNLYVDDIPIPSLSKGKVLIENKFSLISAGTERSTVKMGQSSLIGKAKQRPDLVAQVLNNIKKEGFKSTFDKVRTKLDNLKALGYSTAGVVMASLDTNNYFQPGDRVACAGQDYASHAEIICVPQNLIVRIPDNVTFEEASFTTLGAIALQGIRQADPKIGERVCVIGLGLLGQLTCQMLNANGCKVLGIDLSKDLVNLAKKSGIDEAINRDHPDLLNYVNDFTRGYGFDSIIITAATSSNDPIELSAEIAGKKAKIVAVGAIKLDIPRDPHFYRKELDLRMSCSYGPGRYDNNYEENGNDYPFGFVRWTEQRNMEAFLQLLSQRKLNVNILISHIFDIENADQAYDIIMGKVQQQPHIGILLAYPNNDRKFNTDIQIRSTPQSVHKISVGFIGAGSFAQSYLIPHVKSHGATLKTVVTAKGITAKSVADKFGFITASSDPDSILNDSNINTVFIATPHNTHASYVLAALKSGKNIFVEKPLAIDESELDQIKQQYASHGGNLFVGYNRRFSPLANELKNLIQSNNALILNYRINAGFIAKDHWTQNSEIGGGRILGEVCHFIDLMQFFTNSFPDHVYAQCINDQNEKNKNDDNVCIIIKFKNGSVGTITYVANGDKSLPKERLELFGNGKACILNDFKEAKVYTNGKSKTINLSGKGHKQEVERFLEAISTGQQMPISFESLYITTKTTFRILDSLSSGLVQKIDF